MAVWKLPGYFKVSIVQVYSRGFLGGGSTGLDLQLHSIPTTRIADINTVANFFIVLLPLVSLNERPEKEDNAQYRKLGILKNESKLRITPEVPVLIEGCELRVEKRCVKWVRPLCRNSQAKARYPGHTLPIDRNTVFLQCILFGALIKTKVR
jgi:hypothetical protein